MVQTEAAEYRLLKHKKYKSYSWKMIEMLNRKHERQMQNITTRVAAVK